MVDDTDAFVAVETTGIIAVPVLLAVPDEPVELIIDE